MLSNALVRDSGAQACGLPPGVSVVERGWLSSNMVLMQGPAELVVVDTGYASHAEQTLAIVEAALARHPLGRGASVRVLNTHLHSDHCGGNAAIQAGRPSGNGCHWSKRLRQPAKGASASWLLRRCIRAHRCCGA
jgi:glyoxylase-like metal-dependent hydrolase (beta-lactamase superfamily II)